jgi:histidinol-phosphate aminotransferase
MGSVTRRQILLGGTALAGAGLISAIPSTPLTPSMKFMRSALGAEIARPDHVIRAHFNENPYGPSRVAIQSIVESIDLANLYADDPTDIVNLLSELNNVAPENVMVGSGSSEVLNVAGLLAGMAGGSVICADPTYQALVRYAENVGATIIRVPVKEDLGTDIEAIKRAIRRDTKLVYLANPNNPVPSIIEKNALREFVLEVAEKRIVYVDEAYHEFVDDPDYASMMDLIAKGQKNLIVSRTASKIHGLAGLRIGFGFAHPDLATQMTQRRTGRLNIIGLKAAHASYQDTEFQDFTVRKTRESLAIVEGMCEELGIRHVKSRANFTFIETGVENDIVQARMMEHGIMTGRAFPPYTRWARISMAKPDEMRYFVQVYKKLFG